MACTPFYPQDWSGSHFSPHIPKLQFLYTGFCDDLMILPTAWIVKISPHLKYFLQVVLVLFSVLCWFSRLCSTMKKTLKGSYLFGKKSASSTMRRSQSSGLIWYGHVSFGFNHHLARIFFLLKGSGFSRCLKQEPHPRRFVFTDLITFRF